MSLTNFPPNRFRNKLFLLNLLSCHINHQFQIHDSFNFRLSHSILWCCYTSNTFLSFLTRLFPIILYLTIYFSSNLYPPLYFPFNLDISSNHSSPFFFLTFLSSIKKFSLSLSLSLSHLILVQVNISCLKSKTLFFYYVVE